MEGKLFVLSGPSGVGKGTVCRELDWDKLDLNNSISMTTRPIRKEKGEEEGVSYFFVTEEEFLQNVRDGKLLEYTRNPANHQLYGTPRAAVEKWLKEGHNVLLEIETDGAAQIMANYPEAVSIFLAPPAMEELNSRLHNRGSENEEEIQARLKMGADEMNLKNQYKYVVINDVLAAAVQEVTAIIEKESGRIN